MTSVPKSLVGYTSCSALFFLVVGCSSGNLSLKPEPGIGSQPDNAAMVRTRPARVLPSASQEEQVLNLIERLIDAHDTGLLEDKADAGEVLGFLYERDEVHTGIAMLDDFTLPPPDVMKPSPPNVRYGVRKSAEGVSYYDLNFSQFGYLICITPAQIASLMKRPLGSSYAAPHGQKNFGGAYRFRTWGRDGDRYAYFSYIRRNDKGACLDHISFEKPLPRTN